MRFLENIFHPTKKESILFIDISAGSVAGAYVHYRKDSAPVLLYSRRIPIEIRNKEPHEPAMLRALEILGSLLIREGAPVLVRYSGSGAAETILISMDAPWQETKVKQEHFERTTPFIFTKKMVDTALEKTSTTPPGKVLADESIIGTSLNGYHVRYPYGKRVHRASVTIFASFIDEKISKSILATIRGLFHTKNILSIAGSSLRYQAMRTMFPHESNAIILDSIGPLVSVALVRKDFFVAVAELPDATFKNNVDAWLKKVTDEFVNLAERYPLPRVIFLLAQESEISSITNALETANLGNLWLSDNPPKIVPILSSHIADSIKQVETSSPDLQLLLMALYWQHRGFE